MNANNNNTQSQNASQNSVSMNPFFSSTKNPYENQSILANNNNINAQNAQGNASKPNNVEQNSDNYDPLAEEIEFNTVIEEPNKANEKNINSNINNNNPKPKNIMEKKIKNIDSNKTDIFWSNCLFIFSLNIFLISIAVICSPDINNINNNFFLF